MKKTGMLVMMLVFMILAATIYFYEFVEIPDRFEELTNERLVSVLYAVQPIPQNTRITQEIVDSYIDVVLVSVDSVVGAPIQSVDQLRGVKTSTEIPIGSYLFAEFFVSSELAFEEGEQLYEIPVTSENAVSKAIEPYDFVTVWVRYPGKIQESEVVVPKIRIQDFANTEGLKFTESPAIKIASAIIKVDKNMVSDLEIARKFELYLTKYGEDESLVLKKTFDRERVIYEQTK